jgi:signal transduction histidine kinase
MPSRHPFQKPLYFDALLCMVTSALFRRLLLSLLLVSRLAAADPILDTVAKIRALHKEEASLGRPAHIEGVVTYYNTATGDLFVQDATGGLYARYGSCSPEEIRKLNIQAGDRLQIEGKILRVNFSNDIAIDNIRLLGKGSLPEPMRPVEDEILSPALDCQWTEVPAVVVDVASDFFCNMLTIEVHGWRLKASVPHNANSDQQVTALMLRPVRLRGVVGTMYNIDKQMTGRVFFVPGYDQITPVAAIKPAAATGRRSVNELLSYDDASSPVVKVEGVVTQIVSDGFYLRDATGGVHVLTVQKEALSPGDRVEADGLAAMAPFRPNLWTERVTLLGHGVKPAPKPLVFDLDNLLHLHAELVTVDADFLVRNDSLTESALQCHADDHFFEAVIPNTGILPKNLAAGDRVRLVGICELATTYPWSHRWQVSGFRLLLPKTDGVIILNHAPWWTLEHLLVVLGIVSAVAFMALGWVWLLRHRVKVQTHIIGSKIRQVGMHEERQRIARELHDSVEQELASIAIQLDNISEDIAGTPAQESAQFSDSIQIVQKMLHHCQQEARTSIRDLRGIELEHRGLTGALRELLPGLAAARGVDFEMNVTGEIRPLAGIAETHLLRIAQESVANAAQHAAASKIIVDLDFAPDAVTLSIRDDGCGFDPAASPPDGHFGLLGIQERAEKIQAALDIESAPGKGTTIRVMVPSLDN